MANEHARQGSATILVQVARNQGVPRRDDERVDRVKYLDPKFSSPANSRAYVEGWERCFGEEEGEAKTEEPVIVEEVTEGETRIVE